MEFELNKNNNDVYTSHDIAESQTRCSNKIIAFCIISTESPLGFKYSQNEDEQTSHKKQVEDKKQRNNTEECIHRKSNDSRRIGDEALKIGNFSYVSASRECEEKPIIVFNLTLKDTRYIAEKYGQESFFYGWLDQDSCVDKDISKYYIDYYRLNDNFTDYKLIETTQAVLDENGNMDFYFKSKNKFKINIRTYNADILETKKPNLLNPNEFDNIIEFDIVVPEIKNLQAFKESFDENRSFMSRSLMRHISREDQ